MPSTPSSSKGWVLYAGNWMTTSSANLHVGAATYCVCFLLFNQFPTKITLPFDEDGVLGQPLHFFYKYMIS